VFLENQKMNQLESDRFDLLVLSSTLPTIDPGETSLVRLIHEASVAKCESRTIIDIRSGTSIADRLHVIWMIPISETSPLRLEDCHLRCREFFEKRSWKAKSYSMVTVFQPDHSSPSSRSIHEKVDCIASGSAFLVICSRPGDPLLGTISMTVQDHDAIENSMQSDRIDPQKQFLASPMLLTFDQLWSFSTRSYDHYKQRVSQIFAILAIFVFLLVLVKVSLSATVHQPYVRYPTPGSSGPKNQLSIFWQNASTWATHDSGEWRVRIDDQAMVPAHLFDKDEERYQQWFYTRYPEMRQVVDNQDYIRASWLGSLDIQVPSDREFHFAH
jgi:hypothetical protein